MKNHNSSYYLFDRICYLSHSNPAPWDGLIHFWVFVLAVSSTCHVHPSDISVAGSLNLLQDFAQLAPSREATCNHMIENNIHHSLSLYSASFSYTMLITFEILSRVPSAYPGTCSHHSILIGLPLQWSFPSASIILRKPETLPRSYSVCSLQLPLHVSSPLHSHVTCCPFLLFPLLPSQSLLNPAQSGLTPTVHCSCQSPQLNTSC